VQVANGNLTIKGEKKEEKEEKKKDYYLQERHYGSFERSFGIPGTVDADKIEANFKRGVLTVTLPKKAGSAETHQEDRRQGGLSRRIIPDCGLQRPQSDGERLKLRDMSKSGKRPSAKKTPALGSVFSSGGPG